jgi:DNA-binding CsgD family transcriptional regulator
VVVNSDGRILLADPTAEAILAKGTPLSVQNGVLHAREARDTDNLHRLIKTCLPCRNGFSLRGGTAEIAYSDSAALTLTVLPVPPNQGGFGLDIDSNADPAAIIALEDAAARRAGQAGRLQAQFGLTAKEANVALECLAGGTREQLAARLKVSDSTVRTHLTRIYEKTRTSRKAELIGLLYRNGISD